EKTYPVQVFHLRQTFEENGEAVTQAQIFAVKSGVLADERDFAHARGGKIFGFAHDGFKAAAAEFSAKLRDHAESAGMVAAFVDFYVSSVARRGENARREVMVKISGQLCRFGIVVAQTAFAGFENFFDFAGADHGVHFGNWLANFVAIAFHHASSDN